MKLLRFPHTTDIDNLGKGKCGMSSLKKMTNFWNDEDLHHRKDTANKTIRM